MAIGHAGKRAMIMKRREREWEKLGGEEGRTVTTGRLGRALRLGTLATRVTGSVVARQLMSCVRLVNGSTGGEAPLGDTAHVAELVVQAMGELKGAAMKVGQMLSADPDLVPPEFATKLASLQRGGPPMKFETVQQVIERAFDRPLHELVRFFDPEPLGSASIGQVHRATRFDGREVAIKVQYPGIAETLESDLRNLRSLLHLGRVVASREKLDALFSEVEVAFRAETDYAQEAMNLQRFSEILRDRPGIRVPKPHLDLTARTVLTMDFVEGEKLDVGLQSVDDPDERSRILTHFVETFVWMFHDMCLLHADPHPGNFLLDREHNVVLLDFGCVRSFSQEFTDGVLELMLAFWNDDMEALVATYRRLGFGDPKVDFPPLDVLRAHHHMVLEPIAHNTPFAFGQWSVHRRLRRYVRQHPSLLRMVPPADSILYLRVAAGLKGLLTRLDTTINVRALAEQAAIRRGLLAATSPLCSITAERSGPLPI